MAANGRTTVASDVKFGVGASVIELYLWFKFGDPSSYGVQTLSQLPLVSSGVNKTTKNKTNIEMIWQKLYKN